MNFWLNNPAVLISPDNFVRTDKTKLLNIIALISIIIGILLSIKFKKPVYYGFTIFIMSLTVFFNTEGFAAIVPDKTAPALNTVTVTGIQLKKAFVKGGANSKNNQITVNNASNISKGSVIGITNILDKENKNYESHVVSSIIESPIDGNTVIVLMNDIEKNYPIGSKILKISDITPEVIPQVDPLKSIKSADDSSSSDPVVIALDRVKNQRINSGPQDYNLELSNQGDYTFQGPPYGNLECRNPSTNNPMGSINVTEYDEEPTMYGTCNTQYRDTGNIMTNTFESGVSQRIDDLLFHKGNSQNVFTPVAVDTIPNDQTAFGNFCYRSPTNLLNPKYGSIFVNDPEKLKLIAKLTKATGTENGGG